MRKISLVYLIPIIIIVIAGCLTLGPKLTPLQRRVMESKELEGTFDDAFRATIAVLQDKGYQIKTSDYDGGIIYAETVPTQFTFATGAVQDKVTVTFEKFTEDRVKIRANIIRAVTNAQGDPYHTPFASKSGPVENPRVYQELYMEVQREMFRRDQFGK